MTRLPPSGADMRGFGWRLLPLERKLAWERDAAQARLAQALQAVRESEGLVRALELVRDEQGAWAAAALRQAPDPRMHRQVLDYLAGVQARLRYAAQRRQALEEALLRARARCGACERSVEVLQTARASSMRGYIQATLLRQDRQADAAWLAHAQNPGTGERAKP